MIGYIVYRVNHLTIGYIVYRLNHLMIRYIIYRLNHPIRRYMIKWQQGKMTKKKQPRQDRKGNTKIKR